MSVHIRTRLLKNRQRSYLVRYRRGGRAYRLESAGTFRTQKEARARRDLIAGELAAGRDPREALRRLADPPRSVELLERFDAFIESRVDVGPKTIGLYRNARERVACQPENAPLGRRDPTEIRPADVQGWIAACADLAPRSLAHYLSTLRQVLDFADIEPNPARSPKVKLPTDDAGEVEAPNNEEWLAIKAHASRRILLALRLIEAEGLRVTEATSLTWGDFDLVEGRIRVSRARTKRRTAGQRWLPLPGDLLDEIAELCPLEDRTRERPVFGLSDHAIRKGLELACRNAGIAHYAPHALRHRRCSLWIAHGFEPVLAKQWSGHSKASMLTDVYGHVVIDPRGDEWRDFWLAAYDHARRPKTPGIGLNDVAESRSGDASVMPQESE
jgi:integrase